jgi:hypothetical protein
MERVLVGVFDSTQQMEAACRVLADCAIPQERIHARAVDRSLRPDVLGACGDDDGAGFFQRLLEGVDRRDERAGQYAEAVRRGGCVVIVDGHDDSRVDEAVKVMERHGAFDIDERVARWRERGWNAYDPQAPRLSAAEIEAEHRYNRPRHATTAMQMAAQNARGAGQRIGGGNAQGAPQAQCDSYVEREGPRGRSGDRVVEGRRLSGDPVQPRGAARVYSRAGEQPVDQANDLMRADAKRPRNA